MIPFHQDFARAPLGAYTRADLERDWPGVTWNDGVDSGRVICVEAEPNGARRALRVSYPRRAVGPRDGGAQWLFPLGGAHDELVLSYRVRFAPGFDFVKGGKLPGLVGGDANTGGSRPNGLDGWSARMMWRPDGHAVQYVYHPDQRGVWGDDLPWARGGQRRFVPGRWHELRHQVRLNTPQRADGRIRGWFDGELALDAEGLRFRDTPALAIDQLYFSTFFGGNDASWAPVRDESVDFADFAVVPA